MQKTVGYSDRVPELMAELGTKSLTEAEKDRGITRLDYTGVGYGYNLKKHYPKDMVEARKDAEVLGLEELGKAIAAQEE